MKIIIRFSLFWALFSVFLNSTAQQLVLTDHGQSDYSIVVPSAPAGDEWKAANELQRYFEQISGTIIPVINDDRPVSAREIVIGNSSRLAADRIRTAAGSKKSEKDGFILQTKNEKLYITGNSPGGTLAGVYTFLEKYLGCRYFSPDVHYIPKSNRIEIPAIHDEEEPVFSYRELYFPGRADSSYMAWHKLNSHQNGNWGMWVHTFDDLVPPETYFKEHPEYFSEIGGKRMPNGQLCLTNPEVFGVLAANLRIKMAARPDAKYWSVSQNDNFLACQCDQCRKAARELGGQSGLMLQFVNRVAALFPDKVISTLAYQYTRSAPKKIKPLPNVNIMLCSIECNRSRPIAEDPSGKSFVKDVKDWTKLTKNILIWDYVVQFRNYISPFPNLRVLQPNLEFFADLGCHMMFQQGSGSSLSEFVELRSYLVAKLLWDPRADANEIMKDFVYGYYENAAPFILDYIDLMHDELEASGKDLWIYGYPYDGIDSYLRPELVPVYEDYFNRAEEAVKEDTNLLERVRFARLPLDFAVLDISLHSPTGELSWFAGEGENFKVKDEMITRLDTFVERCNRMNIKILNETGTTPDDYMKTVRTFILKNSDRHPGIGKKVTLLTPFSPKYDAGGAQALTDGKRGIDDYHFNWLGFEGNDLEVVIDMGKPTPLTEVSADFIQDIKSWVFLPKEFTVSYSNDGQKFLYAGSATNIIPQNKTGTFIHTFTINFANITARYVKVKADALKTCPPWHIGAGQKSWIFTDEIVIK